MKTLKNGFILIVILMIALLAACNNDSGSKETNGNSKPNNDNKPETQEEEQANVPDIEAFDPDKEYTLTFVAPWGDSQVNSRFADRFTEKYPNITINHISSWTDPDAFEEIFAKKIVPDVYIVLGNFDKLEEIDMLEPLDDYLSLTDINLDVFREGAIDAIRVRDPKGESRLLGIPVEDVVTGLFYNTEIFDKFGVDYPTDNMTWDEVLDLARKVSGEIDGEHYYGLETHSLSQAILQLSVTGTDPETGEVLFVQKPEYAKYFDLIKQIMDIPGNLTPDDPDMSRGLEARNFAMNLRTVSNIPVFLGTEGLEFNVVSFPSWADKPGVMPNNLPLTFAMSPHSENKAAVLKLLEFLSSEEQMKHMAEAGVAPVSDNPEIIKHLATDGDGEIVDFLNIEGIYSGTPASPAEYSAFGPDVLAYGGNFIGEMTTEFMKQYRESKVDVNTFIREMVEIYEVKVEDEKNRN